MNRYRQKSVNLNLERSSFNVRYNDGRSISPVSYNKKKMKIQLDKFNPSEFLESVKPKLKIPKYNQTSEIKFFPQIKLDRNPLKKFS